MQQLEADGIPVLWNFTKIPWWPEELLQVTTNTPEAEFSLSPAPGGAATSDPKNAGNIFPLSIPCQAQGFLQAG